jgi:hypothetical protein
VIGYFSVLGNTAEERDLLQIQFRGEMIKGASNFKVLWGFHHICI